MTAFAFSAVTGGMVLFNLIGIVTLARAGDRARALVHGVFCGLWAFLALAPWIGTVH